MILPGAKLPRGWWIKACELRCEEEYWSALGAIRKCVADLLAEGYPREVLCTPGWTVPTLLNLSSATRERFRLTGGIIEVEGRGAPDEAEDPILDVMDLLVGWCSPGAKL